MHKNITKFLIPVLSIICNDLVGQTPFKHNPDILTKNWSAKWISHPEINSQDFGVFLFRKNLILNVVPKDFIIHLSADNRYKFYVNGQYVCKGPARGDELHWRFESVDLTPFLKKGQNNISVEVWNFGPHSPGSQHSVGTGLIVQGDGLKEQIINTNNSWFVHHDKAYSPIPININDYYVVGPGERFDGADHPWGWKEKPINQILESKKWQKSKEIEFGRPLKSLKNYGNKPSHVLVPRPIPFMEEYAQRFGAIRYTLQNEDGITVEDNFIKGNGSLEFPANTKTKMLLDQFHLTNAYPVLNYSKGKSSKIKITYAESLRDSNNLKKNRNVVANKIMIGNHDIVIPDGGEERIYKTLWWRTFRYVELYIVTGNEPLIINDFSSIFTGYPLEEKATFETDDDLHDKIWEVAWRTQRLCAGENFFDCPYYEQLQYEGDTRIQCLVTRYVSGDTLLMKNALISFYDSYLPLGLTQSRYPSKTLQVIPPFSLIWVTMLYDYWMLCNDPDLVETMLPTAQNILKWFENNIDESGMVNNLEWWNFVDWVDSEGWVSGIPPGLPDHPSSIINLQYVYTLQKAVKLFDHFGFRNLANKYQESQNILKKSVFETCFDKSRKLLADNPLKKTYSQHANIMAVLTGLIDGQEANQLLNKISSDKTLAKASYYYTFYFIEAWEKIGHGHRFINMLISWEDMLNEGLTTFKEKPEPSRSDCHAWSASPLYFNLALICGIKPLSNGFNKVIIKPNLGILKNVKGGVPHRNGDISVDFQKSNGGTLSGTIILPPGLDGEFHNEGKIYKLKGGTIFSF